ncbi:MAG: NAAT family transporter [Chitinophagales bacterium]|nr:NAAT family transporter [Chitinophagales bacterium]
MEFIFKVFLSIFSIINPFGTIPIFLSLTTEMSRKDITKVSLYTSMYVLLILLVSFFLGNNLLYFFGISIDSLRIGGGIVIASSGFSLLTGTFNKHKGMKKKFIEEELSTKSEIAFTPLAIPMLAGPGTISTLIGYRNLYTNTSDVLSIGIALLLVVVLIFIILKSSQLIFRILGSSGLNALSRIIGFFLIAIGVEQILKTVFKLMH